METTTAPATLLIFTLGASAQRRRRRLLPRAQAEQELALHQRCLDQALGAGRASGCRLLVSSPGALDLPSDATLLHQQGSGFGERLAAAVAEARRVACGPLVLLGSDVPEVQPRHIALALERLAADRSSVVIGPSPDGGLYLLASHQPLDLLLEQVSWCRRDTRRRLTRTLRGAGLRVTFLEPLRDLDSRADLERWLSSSMASQGAPLRLLALALQAILAGLRRLGAPRRAPLFALRPLSAAAGRAPPSVL